MQHACVQVYTRSYTRSMHRSYHICTCVRTCTVHLALWLLQCACAALVLHVLRCIRISINAGRLLRALDLYCFRWVGRVAFRTEF